MKKVLKIDKKKVDEANDEENILKVVDEIGHKNGIHYIKIISKE